MNDAQAELSFFAFPLPPSPYSSSFILHPSSFILYMLPHRFLFRFAMPCGYRHPLWNAKGPGLEEKYCLVRIAELEPAAAAADSHAWSELGLALTVHVRGKRQPPWCRGTRAEDSDGVRVWIDTRDVHNVHRAGRFCHGFVFLPAGRTAAGGPRGLWMPINTRPRATPHRFARGCCKSVPSGARTAIRSRPSFPPKP